MFQPAQRCDSTRAKRAKWLCSENVAAFVDGKLTHIQQLLLLLRIQQHHSRALAALQQLQREFAAGSARPQRAMTIRNKRTAQTSSKTAAAAIWRGPGTFQARIVRRSKRDDEESRASALRSRFSCDSWSILADSVLKSDNSSNFEWKMSV